MLLVHYVVNASHTALDNSFFTIRIAPTNFLKFSIHIIFIDFIPLFDVDPEKWTLMHSIKHCFHSP